MIGEKINLGSRAGNTRLSRITLNCIMSLVNILEIMKLNNLEIYERVFSSHWFLTSYNGIGFVFDFSKIGGGNFISQVIYKMENQMCGYIFDREEFEKAANFTANKLINDLKWRKAIYQKIDYYTKHYFEAGEKLRK